jgi:hypothetical protein
MEGDELTALVAQGLSVASSRPYALRFVLVSAADGRRLDGVAVHVAGCMKTCSGRELLAAVRIANYAPDPAYLAPLVEHALDSDYSEEVLGPLEAGGRRSAYISVFRDASIALFKITDGAIGADMASAGPRRAVPGRADMVVEWRKWWEDHRPRSGAPESGTIAYSQGSGGADAPREEGQPGGASDGEAALDTETERGLPDEQAPQLQSTTRGVLIWSALFLAVAAVACGGIAYFLRMSRTRNL